jgi:putative holliday junction resolvase
MVGPGEAVKRGPTPLTICRNLPPLEGRMTNRPRHPRAAAVDLGKARVGVAVSDELGLYAHPRPPLDGRNRKALLGSLARLAQEEGIDRFLVGLPLDQAGRQGPAAAGAAAFAEELARVTGIEVELVDERLTTVEASRQLRASGVKRKREQAMIDGVAAAVMLQSWLDSRRG